MNGLVPWPPPTMVNATKIAENCHDEAFEAIGEPLHKSLRILKIAVKMTGRGIDLALRVGPRRPCFGALESRPAGSKKREGGEPPGQFGRQHVHSAALGAEIGGRILGRQVAPALVRPLG